jgi:electron transfer flavoprotein alpha subunit
MKYLVVAEQSQGACELVTAARQLGADNVDIEAVVFSETDAAAVAGTDIGQVTQVELAEGACMESVAGYVAQQAQAAGEATVLLSATNRLVNAAGNIAHNLDTSAIVDVTGFVDGAATHLLFGGALVVDDKPRDPFAVYAVAAGSFEPAATDAGQTPIIQVPVAAAPSIKVIGVKPKESVTADLPAAKRVVCVGRGAATPEGYELCQQLATALGAELGCSRPVTEGAEALMPRELYIGSSGAVVSPELYVGVGVSGQTQHTMGMYNSDKVVVINNASDALFFNNCDYGIVGACEDVIPALLKALG